jgi:diguanylate cyclase (GGDEF)-like protein/PAS domain S-box-containing protein
MSGVWQALLSSLAVVGAVTSVWTHARAHLPASRAHQSLTFGVVMGGGAILSMMTALEVQPGLTFDLRSALISVAGFFGGPIAGVLAATIAVAYRLALGGVGAPVAGLSMFCTAMIGMIGNRWVAGRAMRERDIVVLAVATAANAAAWLAILPLATRVGLLPPVFAPVTCLIFVATLLAGLALLHEARLRESVHANMVYRAIVEMLPDSLNFKNPQGQFEAANIATARLMRANSAQDLIGKSDFDFYPVEVARGFRADEEAVMQGGVARTIEQTVTFADGALTRLSTLKKPVLGTRGELVGLITLNRDVTEKKRLEDQLQTAHGYLEDALTNMADGLVLYDRDGIIQFSNLQYRQLFPITEDLRIPGAALADIIRKSIERGEEAAPETADFEGWLAQRCLAVLRAGNRTIQLSNERWIEARTRIVRNGGSLVLLTDVTDRKRAENALKQANEQLARLAWVDGLTGLTNRRGFDEAFDREFRRGARDGQSLGLLLIDVDRFKAYNDAYGHQSGDRCLQLIGEKLRTTLRRPADLAARYGGEEFVVLLPNNNAAGAAKVAEALRRAVKSLRLPHRDSEHRVVTISIGVTAHFPGQEIKQTADLLRRADDTLYKAKAGGRDQTCLDVTPPPSAKLAKAS